MGFLSQKERLVSGNMRVCFYCVLRIKFRYGNTIRLFICCCCCWCRCCLLSLTIKCVVATLGLLIYIHISERSLAMLVVSTHSRNVAGNMIYAGYSCQYAVIILKFNVVHASFMPLRIRQWTLLIITYNQMRLYYFPQNIALTSIFEWYCEFCWNENMIVSNRILQTGIGQMVSDVWSSGSCDR